MNPRHRHPKRQTVFHRAARIGWLEKWLSRLPDGARHRALELQPTVLVLSRSVNYVIRRLEAEINSFPGGRWADERAPLESARQRLIEAIQDLERFDARLDTTRLWTEVIEGIRQSENHLSGAGSDVQRTGRGKGPGRSRALECLGVAIADLEQTDPQFLGDLRYVFDEIKKRATEEERVHSGGTQRSNTHGDRP
jgi:exonuclease VII small subunit